MSDYSTMQSPDEQPMPSSWTPQHQNPPQHEWPRPPFDHAYAAYPTQPYAAQPAAGRGYGPPHQAPAYMSPRPVWVPPYPRMFLVSPEAGVPIGVDDYRNAFATGPYARGPYRCRRCGQMKRLHTCTYSVDQRSVSTQTYPLSITTTTKLITVSSSWNARVDDVDDDAEAFEGNPSESSRTSSVDGPRKRVRFEEDLPKSIDTRAPKTFGARSSEFPKALFEVRPDVETLPKHRVPLEYPNPTFII